ncbi:MAG: hypothetical protein EBX40_07505 [Gammaproteobacteria bacterium]|nr:hypothetical protein [Gammaproteobacteria bacterium]
MIEYSKRRLFILVLLAPVHGAAIAAFGICAIIGHYAENYLSWANQWAVKIDSKNSRRGGAS